MADIWVFGDSLTAGNCGESWVRIVEKEYPVKAFGLDGDTLSGIAMRCKRHLKRNSPDVLVLEAGANDVMQPFIKKKGTGWEEFISDMNSRGARAYTDSEGFLSAYRDLVAEIRGLYAGPLMVMSLPLLSEDSGHSLNRKSESYNRQLKIFCEQNGIVYTDIYTPLKNALKGQENNSESFHFYKEDPGLFIRDIKAVRSGTSWNEISRDRGLEITVDGSHLNRKGAGIVAGVFIRGIKECRGEYNEKQ